MQKAKDIPCKHVIYQCLQTHIVVPNPRPGCRYHLHHYCHTPQAKTCWEARCGLRRARSRMGVVKVVKVVKHVTSVKVEREKCGGRLPSQVRIIITLLPRYYIKCSISFYPGSTPQGGGLRIYGMHHLYPWRTADHTALLFQLEPGTSPIRLQCRDA